MRKILILMAGISALFLAGTYYVEHNKLDEKFLMGFEPVYRHLLGGEPMR